MVMTENSILNFAYWMVLITTFFPVLHNDIKIAYSSSGSGSSQVDASV